MIKPKKPQTASINTKKHLNTKPCDSAAPGLRASLRAYSFVPAPVISRVASNGALKRGALLEMIVRAAPDGIVVCDAQGRIMLANTAAKTLAQLDPAGQPLDLSRRIWGEMFDARGRRVPVKEWPWTRALEGETITAKECRLVRTDGRTRDILFSAVPLRIHGEHMAGVVATLVEVTGIKRAELKLREQAMLRERGRLAADIHDTLTQELSAIVIQLEAAEDEFQENLESVQRRLRCACDSARESLAQVRHFMRMLSAGSLDNENFASSLSQLAQRIFAATSVELKFSVHGEVREPPPHTRFELLRIAREALLNVLKHAQAQTVCIRLTYERECLHVRVDDDGQGFASSLSNSSDGFGLIGMRKRVECLGGRVAVTSQPGLGTRIAVRIPVSSSAVQAAA